MKYAAPNLLQVMTKCVQAADTRLCSVDVFKRWYLKNVKRGCTEKNQQKYLLTVVLKKTKENKTVQFSEFQYSCSATKATERIFFLLLITA